jgi:antirestriction protein ArdC
MARLYEEITERILTQLQNGTVPWVKPWAFPLPYNCITQRAYSGINTLLLWSTPYERPAWVTFRQAAQLNGRVKKGERATRIVYVSTMTKRIDDEERRIPFLKAYYVFNVAQVDRLPAQCYTPPATPPGPKIDEIEHLIRSVGADIRHGGAHAYYNVKDDFIQMPPVEYFTTRADHYATVLHELIHWTGAKSRLDRELGRKYGPLAYSAEEICAEIGAALLSAEFGITTELHHADYIAGYVQLLTDYKHAIVTAASRATAAVEFLKNRAGPYVTVEVPSVAVHGAGL